jgi:hypothetical protein
MNSGFFIVVLGVGIPIFVLALVFAYLGSRPDKKPSTQA